VVILGGLLTSMTLNLLLLPTLALRYGRFNAAAKQDRLLESTEGSTGPSSSPAG